MTNIGIAGGHCGKKSAFVLRTGLETSENPDTTYNIDFLYSEIVKELLRRWPELCKICNSSNTSPLYSAAVQGHLDVVNAILDTDVNSIRIVRKNGKTALHTTARYGLLHIVKALIERDRGIISIKDKKGQTALHMAVKGQDTSVVEELLESHHSILNKRDKKGNSTAHIATRKSRPQSRGQLTNVYKGRINHMTVAIKMYNSANAPSHEAFTAKVLLE
ncbi:Ankyrin repeat region domain-containing protein [Forsythia ovata]|uniref:Ankyrin repeat region domain-containing protein n=1 Tax=Forsythia ovata TaxID=205694 RepID=A0ABD1VK62_9LAMI